MTAAAMTPATKTATKAQQKMSMARQQEMTMTAGVKHPQETELPLTTQLHQLRCHFIGSNNNLREEIDLQ